MAGNTPNWCAVCYGNILRSQVLEQYLRHYSKIRGTGVNIRSAGIAAKEEFPDKDKLYDEIYRELKKRGIHCSLNRNPWDGEVEEWIESSDLVLCADNHVRNTVLERMGDRINTESITTFYEAVSEGEREFEDTYDYEQKKQDPVRFKNAFDELERIAVKLLDTNINP
jgi:protein-tyrosine-phosphatase